MRGDRAELPARSSSPEILAVAVAAVVVVGGLTLLTSTLEAALLLGTFAASSLLVFAYPDAPFSQPRNVLLGHLIGSACGLTAGHFLPYWWAPAVAVGALMAFATLLTNFVSNASAAAVCTPIAMSLAANLGAPAEPFVLAVLFGCNLCYATPMAYQTNLIIMTAARYEFRDFVRAGLPLALLMIVVLAVLLVKRYGM